MLSYGYVTDNTTEGHYIEVAQDKLHELIRLLLVQVEVDEVWYRATYKDVDSAIRDGGIKSAREHYIAAGYFENRLPRPIKVDEAWYLRTYPDVAAAIQNGDANFSTGKEHFEANGYQEGRLPSSGWSLLNITKPRIIRAVA